MYSALNFLEEGRDENVSYRLDSNLWLLLLGGLLIALMPILQGKSDHKYFAPKKYCQ